MRRTVPLIYPHGTFQTPSFYWRGGDEYRDSEYVRYNYLQAKIDRDKAEKELKNVKDEYSEITEKYSEADNHAVAVSKVLGKGSKTTTENSEKFDEIQKLTNQIQKLEEKIADANAISNQMYLNNLLKEKGEIYVNIEKQSLDMNARQTEIDGYLKQYIDILVSEQWREANDSTAQFNITSKERRRIRQVVEKFFADQNYGEEIKQQPELDIGHKLRSTGDSRLVELINLLHEKNDLYKQVQEAEHQRYMAETYKQCVVRQKINMLERINYAMNELGLEPVDTEELYTKYIPDKSNDTEERPKSSMQKRKYSKPRKIKKPQPQSSRA